MKWDILYKNILHIFVSLISGFAKLNISSLKQSFLHMIHLE